jgi:hypothetical protein
LTLVVLVVLAVVWVVVLGPSLFRRAVDRRSSDSIGSFHHQLRVLERTGPSLMAPVHRLGTSLPSVGLDSGLSVKSLSVKNPSADFRRGLAVVPALRGPTVARAPLEPSTALRRPDPYFRRGACKRRRDVLIALLCALVGAGLIGAIPGLHIVLAFAAAVAAVSVAYIGLLIRLRNRALERQVKLRYLPRAGEYEPPIVVRRVASH